MPKRETIGWIACAVLITAANSRAIADVNASAADGFQIQIIRELSCSSDEAYRRLVGSVSQWWDSDHTYTGDSGNMAFDLDQYCLLEKLPSGGFVRHMEIVFHQPGNRLRISGGMGPLQELGVSGTMSFSFHTQEEQTQVSLTYHVCGSSLQQLDQLAPVVDRVLSLQMDRFKKYCE